MYRKRCEAVFKSSAQDVVRGITLPVAKGGRMRVRTGFLRGSLMASTAVMPTINPAASPPPDAELNSFTFDAGAVAAVLVGASITDTIYLGFTASYAVPREYRDGFIEGERLKWPQTVKRNTDKAVAAFP